MAVPLALAAAERLLQAPVPEGVVHRLCPPHLTDRVVERYVEQRVLRDRPSMSPARLNPRRVAWRLLVPNRRYLEQRLRPVVDAGRSVPDLRPPHRRRSVGWQPGH